MNDGQIDHPDQHEDPRRAPGQPPVVKGVPQGDDPGIQKQQHQLRGQAGVPDPPGSPHWLAPRRAADQRHQGADRPHRCQGGNRQIGHFDLPDHPDEGRDGHRQVQPHRPHRRRDMKIHDPVAFPLLIVRRGEAKSPPQTDDQQQRAQRRQPGDPASAQAVQPLGDRQLM